MYRFKQFIDSLEHYELIRLRQHLEKGDLDIGKEIKEKLKEHEKKHAKYCATCSSTIISYNINTYNIIFGPDDFKKKASFCGLDCLEYFLIKLKQMKEGDTNAEKIE